MLDRLLAPMTAALTTCAAFLLVLAVVDLGAPRWLAWVAFTMCIYAFIVFATARFERD